MTHPPRNEWDDRVPIMTGATVHIDDDSPIDTGLLDSNGNKLYRRREKHPVGFDVSRRGG